MAKYYLAVDIGATKTLLGIFDEHDNLKYKEKFLTSKNSFIDNVKKMKNSVRKYIKDYPLENYIHGIGLGLPAIYDEENDLIKKAVNISNWENERVKKVLNSEIKNTEVCLHTDVYAALLGEKIFGLAKNASDFINISIGTGIGMGIFLNGSLYTGANNFAGGIGHTIYQEEGYQCDCGKKGCVENYVCGKAMERLFNQKILLQKYSSSSLYKRFKEGARITSYDILDASYSNDKLCVDIMNEIGFKLGIAISNIVMLFGPELIILNGGVITNSPPFLMEKIKNTVAENIFSNIDNKTFIKKSLLGEDANLYGNYWAIKKFSSSM